MRKRMRLLILIGKRIQALREGRKWTREHFSQMLGISASQLYKWERGVHEPPATPIAEMSKLFEVTPDYLLGLTDSPQETFLENNLTAQERELLAFARAGNLEVAIERLLTLAKTTVNDT
jgi:transcriptional regulator with XRE-family HTH domain